MLCSAQWSFITKWSRNRSPSKLQIWMVPLPPKNDAQLFVVLSSLTIGESFDIATSSGGGHWYLRLASCAPPHAKLQQLTGAVEPCEDLMGRYCIRRDAQGPPHTITHDIRLIPLDSRCCWPGDLEKPAQLNRLRLMTYSLLREEIMTSCESRGHVRGP